MKNYTTPINPSKLCCTIFGHKYKVTKKVTYHIKEYKCSCCNRELTTNSNGKLTELTPTFKDINAALSRIYLNKLARMKTQRLNTSAA